MGWYLNTIGMIISKVGISGKYNLWLSPGVWPTGVFFVGENTPLGLKTPFVFANVIKIKFI